MCIENMSKTIKSSIADWLRSQKCMSEESDGSFNFQADMTLLCMSSAMLGGYIVFLSVLPIYEKIMTMIDPDDYEPDVDGEDFEEEEKQTHVALCKSIMPAGALYGAFTAVTSGASGASVSAVASSVLTTAAMAATIPFAVGVGVSLALAMPLMAVIAAKKAVLKYDARQTEKRDLKGPVSQLEY